MSPVTIATGTRLGTYEIAALLGAGGMGEVYRARDARLGRDVALKVLAPRLAGNRDAIARFEQEARSASALSHPHILHIYDVGSADVEGEPLRYMTMELVDGVPLSKKIHEDAAELRDLVGWLAQVADGLAKAHDAGIVHRDLKPDNVMISRDGYAKILDFGLAKLVERPMSPDDATLVGGAPQSTPGIIVGTVAYMSPEQAQGKTADARSDIFAFGCMLYEAAARRRAFSASSIIDTLHKVVHDDPDLGGIDERVARIVRKCLAKNPDARYASIRDVANELRGTAQRPIEESAGKTIAVLPFDDLSAGRDNEYFAEGLAEEITSDLSKLRTLRVLSRASVRKYRGEEKDIARVAADLGAQYVIDGSVRKAGNQLRITAQLIDTRTSAQLWSQKYSGTIDEIFDIQESVARSIVEQLQIELTPSERAALGERSVSNVAAWECYQRARMHVLRFDEEGLGKALKEIENGLAIAGPNVALRVAQGYVYWQYYNAGVRPDPEYLDRAEAIAREILAEDPESTHGNRLMAMVDIQKQRIPDSIRHLEKVLAADPNDADALMYAAFLGYVRKRIDMSGYVERLAAIDPLNASTHLMRAFGAMGRGDFAGALPHAERAHALAESIFGYFHVLLLVLLGRGDEARAVAETMRSAGDDLFSAIATALATGDPAALTEEVKLAARADLQYSSWIAEIYAVAGEIDTALDWLEHSIDRGYTAWEYFTRHDRLLDNLRGNARFEKLMERAYAEWAS